MTTIATPCHTEPSLAADIRQAACQWIGQQARAALLREVMLTPKPGLVDQRNTGAHQDMDLDTFQRSTAAIAPSFVLFAAAGMRHAHLPASAMLPLLRPIGIRAEQAMLDATGGVNTHKGGIFALGLLCASAGRLFRDDRHAGCEQLCQEVAAICHGLVERELGTRTGAEQAGSAGERLYQRHGMTGARGEAAAGYTTVLRWSLPVYLALQQQGVDEERALLQAMLHLLAHNADTNLVARGGPEGLAWVQQQAGQLLATGGVLQAAGRDCLQALDDALIARRLSPGGSADLLAVTCFLSCFADRAGQDGTHPSRPKQAAHCRWARTSG